MSDYALHVDPDTEHKEYKRFAPRSTAANADFPDFKNFQFDGPEASNAMKFAVSPEVNVETVCVLNSQLLVNVGTLFVI